MSLAFDTPRNLAPNNPAGQIVEMHRVPHITMHAFCDTSDLLGSIEKVAADRRMSRVNTKINAGGIAAAIELYRKSTSPNLIIIESRATIVELLAQLRTLADVCVSATKVIVIGYQNDVTIYRELLLRGVSEYIVAPFDPLAIIVSISRLYQEPGATKFGRTLAFIGATGGAGSSTLAQNVASTITRTYDCNVILVDMDLPFGTSSLGFDLNPAQGIAQALKDGGRFDDLLLERLLTKYDDHLQVLTAPANLEQPCNLEEGAFERLLDVAQSNAPFVVLDVPHVWTSWAKKTLLAADEVVITAQPNLASLRNTKSLIEWLREGRPNDAPPKLVLNQVGVPRRSEIKPEQFAAALSIEPIACIPFDSSTVSTAANNGQMIIDIAKKSAISKNLAAIAQVITGNQAKYGRKKPFVLSRLWGG